VTIASKVEDITNNWSCNTATGNEYGLLTEILGINKYDHQTGISKYIKETKPDTYYPNDTTTLAHTRKAGTFTRVSLRESLPTFVMQLTSNSTPNSNIATPPTATPPPSKSSTTLT
jgi:hypothetical protein